MALSFEQKHNSVHSNEHSKEEERCYQEYIKEREIRRDHPYPDIYHPSIPYPIFHINPLFRDGVLKNPKGETVKWTELLGKSVALYFADFSKYRCRSFLPVLCNVYRTFNESGSYQKVEIIFVSLDKTKEAYNVHRSHQPWLAIPFDDELIDALKGHYRVMNPGEIAKYGCGPLTNPPALLVIRGDGQILQLLEVSEETRLWRKWDVVSQRF